jgi:uncharacterized membrane protein
MMKAPLMLFALAGGVFLVIDLLWLAWLGRGLYVAEIGPLLRKTPNLAAAAAFYILYLAGLTLFVTLPAFTAGMPVQALLAGAAFGLVAYATYDLTSLAVIEGFTLRIALIDMAWGAALTAFSAWAAVLLARQFA